MYYYTKFNTITYILTKYYFNGTSKQVNMNVQMHQFPPAMMMQQWGHQANMLFSHQPHQPPYPVPRNSPQVPPTPPQPVRKAEKEPG